MFNSEEILKKYKLFWQYPAITEKTFYNQNKFNNNFLGFPWATIFDKRYSFQVIYNILRQYTISNVEYYTCCQHIIFRIFIPLWKALNIKTVYVSHKLKGEDIIDGITFKPCPLYAVNIETSEFNKEFQNVDLLNKERKILYNFIGGYQEDYLTQIRPNIFKMNHPENTIIKNTGDWHFNKLVYNEKQNVNQELNLNDDHNNKTKYYNELLLNSRYTLAPSGTGPNSIRFWEALAVGSIPVLLADTLELPDHKLWDDAIIKLKESDIELLPKLLEKISESKENHMRENCLKIYNHFKNNFINKIHDNIIPNVLFTSYLCNKDDEIINQILQNWKIKNPDFEIKYFSDDDIDKFFENHYKKESYKKLKNGVAKADFFRICYINMYGGYWFDIDIEPLVVNKNNLNNIALFDLGYQNISYMLIGGKKNQDLFNEVIEEVSNRINKFYNASGNAIMNITGPRIIQGIIFKRMNIINNDGCFPGLDEKIYFNNTNYEFSYRLLKTNNVKTNLYNELQKKYNKVKYSQYNFI